MKKRLLVIATVLMIMGNALFVSASENLDRFSEAIKGTWKKVQDMTVAGYEHSDAFMETLKLPNENIFLTEDSNGLVYITAYIKDSMFGDHPTSGVLTMSDEKMVIQDELGGIILYEKEE